MGKTELEDNTQEVLSELTSALFKAAEIIGGKAETYAKQNLTDNGSVDTGNLRNSITHLAEDEGHTVVIGTTVKYAPFVELGTGRFAEGGGGRQTAWSYMDSKGVWHTTTGARPKPYLRPAIENHREEYMNLLHRVLEGG